MSICWWQKSVSDGSSEWLTRKWNIPVVDAKHQMKIWFTMQVELKRFGHSTYLKSLESVWPSFEVIVGQVWRIWTRNVLVPFYSIQYEHLIYNNLTTARHVSIVSKSGWPWDFGFKANQGNWLKWIWTHMIWVPICRPCKLWPSLSPFCHSAHCGQIDNRQVCKSWKFCSQMIYLLLKLGC